MLLDGDLPTYSLPALPCLQKGFDNAVWTPIDNAQSSAGLSLEARKMQDKSLTPIEAYECVIAVNAAVDAYARNISKAKWRVFDKDGDEITGGALWGLLNRPNSYQTMRGLTREIVSWWMILGEYAIWHFEEEGKRSLLPIPPKLLEIEKPSKDKCNNRGDVLQWRYTTRSGKQIYIRDDALWFDARFSASDGVRGLPPLTVGQLTASTLHATIRYNKNFHDNGAIPSHLIVLPDGTPRGQRETFTREYMREYSNHQSSAHKVMVVSGKDVDVKPLEQPFQDGAFMDLSRWNVQQIGQLYKVPAIEMNIYDKTRFDTALEERKLFAEGSLMPEMEALSESFQYQVADKIIEPMDKRRGGKKRMSKTIQKAFDEAKSGRETNRLIVLLDPDTMPIMGDVNLARVAHAEKIRDTFLISPRKAEVFVGLDFDEERPERDDIYCPKTHQNISHPEKNPEFVLEEKKAEHAKDAAIQQAKLKPKVPPKPASGASRSDGKASKGSEATPEARTREKHAKRSLEAFYRALRRLTFDRLDEGTLWSLEEADKLAESFSILTPLVKTRLRIDRDALRRIIRTSGGSKDEIRAYLNGIKAKSLLE